MIYRNGWSQLVEWRVTFKSSERSLKDILHKTGSLLIRTRYIEQLKKIANTYKTKLRVQSPEGVNKLASSFFIVEFIKSENQDPFVTGLFEYAYGAIRLVAIDNMELAEKTGDEIIAFFEGPLQQSDNTLINVYES